jgi:hypothetical protein
MRFNRHHRGWGVVVAVVAAIALLTLSEAWGQRDDGAPRDLDVPRVPGVEPDRGAGAPAVPRDPGVKPERPGGELAPQRDRDPGGVDKSNRAASKVKRAAKRTLRRARDIDPVR